MNHHQRLNRLHDELARVTGALRRANSGVRHYSYDHGLSANRKWKDVTVDWIASLSSRKQQIARIIEDLEQKSSANSDIYFDIGELRERPC